MTVAQFLAHFASPNRANYEQMKEFPASANEYARLLRSEEFTNVIFPERKLVSDIFGPQGVNIEQHKHLAHVRRINVTGMPDFGVNQEGTFSVVVSHRTGKVLWFPYTRKIRFVALLRPHTPTKHSIADIHQGLTTWISQDRKLLILCQLNILTPLFQTPLSHPLQHRTQDLPWSVFSRGSILLLRLIQSILRTH